MAIIGGFAAPGPYTALAGVLAVAVLVTTGAAGIATAVVAYRARRALRAAQAERRAAEARSAAAGTELAEALKRRDAARTRLADAVAQRGSARAEALGAHELRCAVDEIGASIGAAPSASAGLGEHIIVPAQLAVAVPNDDGTYESLYTPDWPAATWYGVDGLDTGREARPAAADPKPIAYLSHHGPGPERTELVFCVEVTAGRTRFVPVASQWTDHHGRLDSVKHTPLLDD